MRWASLLLVILATGCPGDAALPQSTARPAARPTASTAPQPPPALRQLVRTVRDVPTGVDDASHAKVVASLSLLAKLIRHDDPATAQTIERRATRLMRSPPYERDHADQAKQALAAALEHYATRISRVPATGVQDAYAAAHRSLARISGTDPLRFQLNKVAAVLRSLANLEAFARGFDAVFTPVYELADVGYRPEELARRVTRANELVAALGAERHTGRAGSKAAGALDAIADALEVSRLDLAQADWRELVSAIRYQAVQLARESSISLDRADRIKAGLLACLPGLHSLSRSHHAAPPLVEAADTAVHRIDEHTALVFQRALIQEAFRAVTDSLWQEVQP